MSQRNRFDAQLDDPAGIAARFFDRAPIQAAEAVIDVMSELADEGDPAATTVGLRLIDEAKQRLSPTSARAVSA